jgi:hypothetical protein
MGNSGIGLVYMVRKLLLAGAEYYNQNKELKNHIGIEWYMIPYHNRCDL